MDGEKLEQVKKFHIHCFSTEVAVGVGLGVTGVLIVVKKYTSQVNYKVLR